MTDVLPALVGLPVHTEASREWLAREDTVARLRSYARVFAALNPDSVLEIGTGLGFTLCTAALYVPSLRRVEWVDDEHSNRMAVENLGSVRPGLSMAYHNALAGPSFEGQVAVAHVNGDRSYEGCLKELWFAWGVMSRVIVGVGYSSDPCVRSAVREFSRQNGVVHITAPDFPGGLWAVDCDRRWEQLAQELIDAQVGAVVIHPHEDAVPKSIPPELIRRREGGSAEGLAFVPTLEPAYSDNDVEVPGHLELRGGDDDNSPEVLSIAERLAVGRRAVLEIGVALYDPDKTITHRILKRMDPSGVYLGVDLADRRRVTRFASHAHFLCADSGNYELVTGHLRRLGVKSLDMLVIDGCHSVNACLLDWRYASLVRPGGVVLVHDTNSHPGPIALVAAVDRGLWDLNEPLLGHADYGAAVLTRRSGDE